MKCAVCGKELEPIILRVSAHSIVSNCVIIDIEIGYYCPDSNWQYTTHVYKAVEI